jgi:hypothetical protein
VTGTETNRVTNVQQMSSSTVVTFETTLETTDTQGDSAQITTTTTFTCDSDGAKITSQYTEWDIEPSPPGRGWSRADYSPPILEFPQVMTSGSMWTGSSVAMTTGSNGQGGSTTVTQNGVVMGSTSVTVPAGDFETLEVQLTGPSGVTTNNFAHGVGLVREKTANDETVSLTSYTP